MPIIFVTLQYNYNISNNKNNDIMVTFKLFANVNPLKPNKLVCVLDSSSISMTTATVDLDVARSLICKKANELASKGYHVKVHEISDTIVDFSKFV